MQREASLPAHAAASIAEFWRERAPRASTGVAGKALDPGYVSAAQFDALKAGLDWNKDKTHFFVFM